MRINWLERFCIVATVVLILATCLITLLSLSTIRQDSRTVTKDTNGNCELVYTGFGDAKGLQVVVCNDKGLSD